MRKTIVVALYPLTVAAIFLLAAVLSVVLSPVYAYTICRSIAAGLKHKQTQSEQ